jgi:hypothetical protein
MRRGFALTLGTFLHATATVDDCSITVRLTVPLRGPPNRGWICHPLVRSPHCGRAPHIIGAFEGEGHGAAIEPVVRLSIQHHGNLRPFHTQNEPLRSIHVAHRW